MTQSQTKPFTITINVLCDECREKVLKLMTDEKLALEMDNQTIKKVFCKKCLKKYRAAAKYYKKNPQ